jgi:hypothetical protein
MKHLRASRCAALAIAGCLAHGMGEAAAGGLPLAAGRDPAADVRGSVVDAVTPPTRSQAAEPVADAPLKPSIGRDLPLVAAPRVSPRQPARRMQPPPASNAPSEEQLRQADRLSAVERELGQVRQALERSDSVMLRMQGQLARSQAERAVNPLVWALAGLLLILAGSTTYFWRRSVLARAVVRQANVAAQPGQVSSPTTVGTADRLRVERGDAHEGVEVPFGDSGPVSAPDSDALGLSHSSSPRMSARLDSLDQLPVRDAARSAFQQRAHGRSRDNFDVDQRMGAMLDLDHNLDRHEVLDLNLDETEATGQHPTQTHLLDVDLSDAGDETQAPPFRG